MGDPDSFFVDDLFFEGFDDDFFFAFRSGFIYCTMMAVVSRDKES